MKSSGCWQQQSGDSSRRMHSNKCRLTLVSIEHDNTLSRQLSLLSRPCRDRRTDDTNSFAQITSQVQSWPWRHEIQNGAVIVRQGVVGKVSSFCEHRNQPALSLKGDFLGIRQRLCQLRDDRPGNRAAPVLRRWSLERSLTGWHWFSRQESMTSL